MTLDTALFDSNQVCLEIPQSFQDEAWRQSQSFSTSSDRWNAYLNRICLNAILSWLQDEYSPHAIAWPNAAALPSFWAVVNGTAIVLDAVRFAIIPSETIDLSELRVPQEWIDIPGWAADYYLAAQVNPDDGWIRIAGYCTHQQLKAEGRYDTSDRTYCLDEDNLTKDLNVLWVARQLCPDEPTKSEIASLPALPLVQAENLLQRLGNPEIAIPRLAVPFELWGALLEHGAWRQRLYQRRLELPEQWSVLQWLSSGVSELASGLGWGRLEFQPNLAGARGTEPTAAPHSILSRQLMIAGQPYELRVIPQGNPEERIWRFELRNASSQENGIPAGFKLRLLTEDLQPFENNEDIATSTTDPLYVEVMLAPGEGLVWEIEPVPDNYDREILRF